MTRRETLGWIVAAFFVWSTWANFGELMYTEGRDPFEEFNSCLTLFANGVWLTVLFQRRFGDRQRR